MTGKRKDKATLRDINIAIDSLDADKADPFIILESSEPINGTTFIQVLQYKDYDKMETCYSVEIQIGDKTDFKQYNYKTNKKAEIKKYFEDYFLYGKSPDIDSWTDITYEVKEHKNVSGIFFLYDLAKNYHRNNKKLFNCYGLYHGDNIAGVSVYQSIAEAIVLLKDIMLSNSNCGEIYYTEDKNRFFLNIVIPNNWKEKVKNVHRIKSLLLANKIFISCYDHNDIFIPFNISPLTKLERLLPCFILIFTEKLLSDDGFLYTVMDYFSEPNFEKFKKVYIDFMSQQKYQSYFVSYENGEDYNFNTFSPLSMLCKNVMNNINLM